MKTIYLVTFCMLMLVHSLSAQMIYKGGGTSNSTFLLGYGSYAKKAQCIYPPNWLTNHQPGNITCIYYKYGSTVQTIGQTLTNFTIQFLQTADTTFQSDTIFFTGLTPAFNSPSYSIPTGTTGSWFPIFLTTPFPYDDALSLVVQTTFDTSSYQSFGTYGTTNTAKKLISGNLNATYGDISSSTWQDFGFDITPVGISNPLLSSVNIFPNPCHDQLWVFRNNDERYRMQIINVTGAIMKEQSFNGIATDVDVSDLSPGIYLLKMFSDKTVAVKQFEKL